MAALIVRIFLVFSLFLSIPVFGQDFIELRGQVVDASSGEPVPFVNIYTANRMHGSATLEDGTFFIRASSTDTLVFSSVGYHLYNLAVSAVSSSAHTNLLIRLSREVKELDEVVVTTFGGYESFKRALLDVELPPETRPLTLPPVKEIIAGSRLTGTPGGSIKGPFSFLYDQFSREAKESRKLDTFRKTRDEYAAIDKKYNLEVVQRITQLSKEDAEAFMRFCTFEHNFLVEATEYELAVAMLDCLESFRNR